MAVDAIEVQKLYVAYFGRPADPNGMDYWTDALDANSIGMADVSASFAASQEYRDTYAGLDNRAIVAEVYQNLFGRAGEEAGVNYWTDLMDRGVISIDDVVKDISEAANGSDSVAFNGKVAAASLFTARVDEPDEIAAYTGDAANDISMEFLATITDLGSAADALKPDVVDAWIERIVDAHGASAEGIALVGVAPAAEPLPGA
ncbi:hypothetical protein ABIB42_003022 [Massilia sp. UYP32]|jgi:hypothetical protein|uniref:DUF4214 domain-containing protein n=1 Tax=Massilia timonae TaxID=47229 RepID=A0A1S2N8C3_9BURK|nr:MULTISPECIES: DUF4214 domain-containing protein [Massilia]OIJ40864.1 hypothetical protein LO55_2205 [Massilia timonae]QYF99608.1 DUF4214 domain-containing protein [Massilia sp. NP310]